MPIYEYRCLKCGKLFEVIQKMSEGGERSANAPPAVKRDPRR